MLWTEVNYSKGTDIIFVDGFPVWDYKVLDNRLVLISEPVEHSETFPKVTVAEIFNELGLFQELELVSDTDGTKITKERIKTV